MSDGSRRPLVAFAAAFAAATACLGAYLLAARGERSGLFLAAAAFLCDGLALLLVAGHRLLLGPRFVLAAAILAAPWPCRFAYLVVAEPARIDRLLSLEALFMLPLLALMGWRASRKAVGFRDRQFGALVAVSFALVEAALAVSSASRPMGWIMLALGIGSGALIVCARLVAPGEAATVPPASTPPASDAPVEAFASRFGLSPREIEVVAALLSGASNKAIAERLFISVVTVKTHVGRIFGKCGVSSRFELCRLADSYRSMIAGSSGPCSNAGGGDSTRREDPR